MTRGESDLLQTACKLGFLNQRESKSLNLRSNTTKMRLVRESFARVVQQLRNISSTILFQFHSLTAYDAGGKSCKVQSLSTSSIASLASPRASATSAMIAANFRIIPSNVRTSGIANPYQGCGRKGSKACLALHAFSVRGGH